MLCQLLAPALRQAQLAFHSVVSTTAKVDWSEAVTLLPLLAAVCHTR